MGAFEASGAVCVSSAPAKPPEDPAEVGFENKRVAAFAIIRSGGANAGAALAGEGSAVGAEPNGFMRLSQPGPEEALVAGRLLEN